MFNCLYRNGTNSHISLHVAFGIVVDHMLFTLELVSLDPSWPVFCCILSKEMGGQIPPWFWQYKLLHYECNAQSQVKRSQAEGRVSQWHRKKHVTEWDDCHSYCAKHNRPCNVLQQWPLPRFLVFCNWILLSQTLPEILFIDVWGFNNHLEICMNAKLFHDHWHILYDHFN